nr:thrombospondin type 3 repeat-containing protein [Candidatus Krumholzibacteria bacterium]
MRTFFLPLCLLVSLTATPLSGQDAVPENAPPPVPVMAGRIPDIHQDSSRLGRVTSAIAPADGLVTVEVAGRLYSTVDKIDGFLERISQKDLVLRVEAGPWPWLHTTVEVPYRTWSDGKGWIPASGSGLGDGFFQLSHGRPVWGDHLHAGLYGGGNIPWGSKAEGLTEGGLSPHLGAALSWRLWQDGHKPEMRLHVNYHRRWNAADETGYGVGRVLFEPWYPRYPAAPGSAADNDQSSLGLGLEFRKGATTLYLDYVSERINAAGGLGNREQYSAVGAGMRWGLMEGWAAHADYLVALSTDDGQTDFFPAYPDLVMEFAVSRQFAIGGQDTDGDGVVDRHDHCPRFPEDIDGFEDEDGCPEWDNDGDGIRDAVDLAPDAPEDYDGYLDEDGLPDPDNDGDGIFDWLDNCPDEPEDFDGYKDEDGCPDDFADRDGDGVEDSRDACPDTPEDLDGFEDGDGCPELDNDLDGIPDHLDKCPNTPEDYDGVEDEDGCPE